LILRASAQVPAALFPAELLPTEQREDRFHSGLPIVRSTPRPKPQLAQCKYSGTDPFESHYIRLRAAEGVSKSCRKTCNWSEMGLTNLSISPVRGCMN